MENDKPLMLTSEPWSDVEARRTRSHAQRKAEQTDTLEHRQKQGHLTAMAELREKSGVSKRPFFWAQGGSRDMFTQAVARNVVALSKEKESPLTKQGVGPLLTPNPEVGMRMQQHREDTISHYQRVIASTTRDRDTYTSFLNSSEESLRLHDENRKRAPSSEHVSMDQDRQEQLEHIADLRERVNGYSLDHDLHLDRLEAARQTHVSWPGHEDWGAVQKSMKGSSSKILTLGHGNRNLDFVAENIARNKPSELHQFGDIVDSQISSGLPLDNVAKRLDACHGAANPMNPSWIPTLQDLEQQGKLPPTDRSDFLERGSSTQKFAQAYQDRGVGRPSVKGVDTTMARFPNSRANPAYQNEVELPDNGGRAPRRDHSHTHQPIFKKPPIG